MDIFSFLKFIPKAALFLFPLALGFLIFAFLNLFKRRKKETQSEPTASPLAVAEGLPAQPTGSKPARSHFPWLTILAIVFLLLSLPLAIILVKQHNEITMRAEEKKLTPTPNFPSKELTPTLMPQCQRIKIYDQDWKEISYQELSQLSLGQLVKIVVKSDREGEFDKGRIRINNLEWTGQNETFNQKPDSVNEFYLECEIGMINGKATLCGVEATLANEFRIEGEVHGAINNEWH